MHTSLSFFLGFFLLAAPAYTQLIGHVGVTTPLNQKRHECNILEYGGVPDNNTDVAPAIHLAFDKCVKHHPGSRLIVPPGNYLLKQSVQLTNGTNWAFQLDGLITAQYGGSFDIPRNVVLQGFAGVGLLNSTINGEGDGLFLLNFIVIVNGISKSSTLIISSTDCIQLLTLNSTLGMVEVLFKAKELHTGILTCTYSTNYISFTHGSFC